MGTVYKAQEDVAAACKEYDIKVTLFHGCGGIIACGGGPTYLAIQLQPPGSVMGTLLSTEEGEMVLAKFGLLLYVCFRSIPLMFSLLHFARQFP